MLPRGWGGPAQSLDLWPRYSARPYMRFGSRDHSEFSPRLASRHGVLLKIMSPRIGMYRVRLFKRWIALFITGQITIRRISITLKGLNPRVIP